MTRLHQPVLAILGVSLAALASTSATSRIDGRLALVARAEVKNNLILLADLLPAGAPAGLLAKASRVSLGGAPEPTSVRRISKAEIENVLLSDPDLLAEIRIPDHVTVTRYHRALTAPELIAAIQAALAREGVTSPPSLDLGSLALTAPVYVSTNDPGLKVTEIQFDALRRQTRFRLWTSKEPHNLPFYVTVKRDLRLPALVAKRDLAAGQQARAGDFEVETRTTKSEVSGAPPLTPADLAGLAARGSIRAGEAVNRSMFTQEVLAEPGLPARLVVEGKGFCLETTVIPLERGVLGQQIRVRDPDTHRILAAEVVGKGRLRAMNYE